MKINVVKTTSQQLIAAYDSDLETIKKLKVGQEYQIDIKQPRNINFHRKFFALINLTFDNQEIYDNIDFMRKELTKACGFYDVFRNHKGNLVYEAKSISFAKMDELEFEQLYNKFLDIIIQIFKFDRKLIESELENFY